VRVDAGWMIVGGYGGCMIGGSDGDDVSADAYEGNWCADCVGVLDRLVESVCLTTAGFGKKGEGSDTGADRGCRGG
jgi:hypothetical protein